MGGEDGALFRNGGYLLIRSLLTRLGGFKGGRLGLLLMNRCGPKYVNEVGESRRGTQEGMVIMPNKKDSI